MVMMRGRTWAGSVLRDRDRARGAATAKIRVILGLY